MSENYKSAGVSLEAGYESVELIKKHIKKTDRLGVMGGIGAFGGMFDLSALNYKEPVLISGTDGVGTKLKIAIDADKHDTVGIDVVAMCVNDIIAQGAEPLFFLDYIAVGKNIPTKIEQIVKGVAEGCLQSNCALVGGETAEMPDMYHGADYDIAGFTVGVVEKSKIIDGSKTKEGQIVIGLASSGAHSNGFSLIRKILFKDNNLDLNQHYDFDKPLKDVLLEPTKLYVKPVLAVLKEVDVKGIANITGGGFHENMPRCLNKGLGLNINKGTWEVPTIFKFLQTTGNIDEAEMYNVFNMGVGMIMIVDASDVDRTIRILAKYDQDASIIGEVVNGEGINIHE